MKEDKFREKRIGSGTYPLTGPLKRFTGDRVLLLGDAVTIEGTVSADGESPPALMCRSRAGR